MGGRRQRLLFPFKPPDKCLFETRLYKNGIYLIAGVDEAGRGSLAGPVVAASVVLPKGLDIKGLDDSKRVEPKKRIELFERILSEALSYGVGIVGPGTIDEINILQATRRAMKLAVDYMGLRPEYLLVDGNQPIETDIPQKVVVKGDARSVSVAAASIVAKVIRDRMMTKLEESYPMFSFSIHKGYGTETHLKELKAHGPTPVHRKSFNINF